MPTKGLLENAALILGLVNGFFLARFYVRDRARLSLDPVHPDVYQWWFRLPAGEHEEKPTCRFGFLVYVGISNAGLRPTTLNRWRLKIRVRNYRRVELRSLTIPNPGVDLEAGKKIFRVLGIDSPTLDGSTRIEAGGSISGMSYYVYEYFESEDWDPVIKNGTIRVHMRARDVFGHRARCRIACREEPLNKIEKMIPGISFVGQELGA